MDLGLTKQDGKDIKECLANAETDNNNLELDLEEDPYETVNRIYEEEKERKGVSNENMPKQIDDYNKYDVPAGEGGSFLKTEVGDNRIRLVTKPLELKYWEEGKGSDYKTHLLQEGEDPPEGKEEKTKYAYLVINREAEPQKVQIYEMPITVFKEVLIYATDKEYGDPTKYDITIKKEGSGLQTKYKVVASPKKTDLTDKEVKMVAEAKQLEDVYAEKKEEEEGKKKGK